MRPQALAAIRSYRLQFRDTSNALARSYGVDLKSDDEARQLAALMLEEQGIYESVEIWDRARLVGAVRANGTPSC